MPLLRRRRNEEVSAFLSEVRASVKVVAVNLIRIQELKSRFGPYEEELKSRLDMAVSELRSLKELIGRGNPSLKDLGRDTYNSIKLMEAYSIISESEGVEFIEENIERILRAARWCDGSISKTLKELHSRG